MLRIGIDIGGTFTDFALWDGAASGYAGVEIFKVPSTPGDFHLGVIEGLKRLIDSGRITRDEPIMIVHGTTVSTNAVIERSSPPVALLVTDGFRDILGIGRLRMNDPVNLFDRRTTPLIPRNMVFEINERMLHTGEVDIPLDTEQLVAAAKSAVEAGAKALAICFLHSYRNPAHEIAAREALTAALPPMEITLSHEIWSQPSEYERASAAVLNAYSSLSMKGYLAEIQAFLRDNLDNARLFISKSNGGVMASNEAARMPIHTLLSGPAAGVTAACALGELLAEPQLLTMDMGGTSTDISLVNMGQAVTSLQGKVGDFPLMMPVTAVEAIGAGGGSIAWVDGKVLHVGPRSAGAFPGPACYGLGGTEPTISDAYLLCGYLSPERPLAGRLTLDPEKAAKAMQPIADALGTDVYAAAEACITVATANMLASALPFISRLGVPPAALSLMSFGGAGAIHGALLADEIDIGKVILPRASSVFCAYGCLVSDLLYDVVESVQGKPVDEALLAEVYGRLGADTHGWLEQQVGRNFDPKVTLTHIADVRYRGQAFDVATQFDPTADPIQSIVENFHQQHERLYGHCSPELPVEILTLRLQIRGALERPRGTPMETSANSATPRTRRPIRYDGKTYDAAIYDKSEMPVGFRAQGPAIIEQETITVLVPPAFDVVIGHFDDVILERRTA